MKSRCHMDVGDCCCSVWMTRYSSNNWNGSYFAFVAPLCTPYAAYLVSVSLSVILFRINQNGENSKNRIALLWLLFNHWFRSFHNNIRIEWAAYALLQLDLDEEEDGVDGTSLFVSSLDFVYFRWILLWLIRCHCLSNYILQFFTLNAIDICVCQFVFSPFFSRKSNSTP